MMRAPLDPPKLGGPISLRPCSTCGERPAGTVQVGAEGSFGWLECKNCWKRTSDGQSFEEASREWNRLQGLIE